MIADNQDDATLRWVSEINEGRRLQELLERHIENTGNWFLTDSKYRNWRVSSQKPILYLHGKSKSKSLRY